MAVENHDGPTVLVLSRQHVPTLDRRALAPAEELRRGAYVLNPGESDPELILIGTGSEVSLIVGAEPILRERGLRVRLVSMPSWELFAQQSAEYRESVLPRAVKAQARRRGGAIVRLGALGRLGRRHPLRRPLRRVGAGRRSC